MEFLQKHVEFINSMKDIDKTTAVRIERKFYYVADCNKTKFPKRGSINDYNILETTSGIYKTGVTRMIEYYGNVDLYKFKANWNGFVPVWNVKL